MESQGQRRQNGTSAFQLTNLSCRAFSAAPTGSFLGAMSTGMASEDATSASATATNRERPDTMLMQQECQQPVVAWAAKPFHSNSISTIAYDYNSLPSTPFFLYQKFVPVMYLTIKYIHGHILQQYIPVQSL